MKIKIRKMLKEDKEMYRYARSILGTFKSNPENALDQIASEIANGSMQNIEEVQGLDGTEYHAEFDSDKTAEVVKGFLDKYRQLSYGYDLGNVVQQKNKIMIIPLPPALDLYERRS
jgi:hypothetical protein